MVRDTARQDGYSLIEMMFVVGIMAILSAIAALQIGASRPVLKGDGGMRVVMGQMNQARELAITHRKYMRLVFSGAIQVQILREDTPTTTTSMSTTLMEGGLQYALISGLPDTPDAFGKATPLDFGTAVNVKFTPDGRLVNQDGSTINGTVFIAWQNQTLSARAITVLGSTGRVRGYRWDGKAWKVV